MKRRTLIPMAVALILSGLLAGLAAAQPAVSAPGERAPGFVDFEKKAAEQQFLHRWLNAYQVEAGLENPLRIELSAADRQRLAEPRPGERRLEVGLVKDVELVFAGSGLGLFKSDLPVMSHGRTAMTEAGLTWTAAATSAGATALRFHFTDFSLPAGAELYLYTAQGQVVGPYTGRGPGGKGDFWSHTLFGDEVTIQLHQRASGPIAGPAARFFIDEAVHVGPKFRLGVLQNAGSELEIGAKSFCSFNEPCIENASCSSIPGAVSNARDAIAHILFRSGGSFFICSGGLLADTDSSTQAPHFLTANHCLSKGREANSLEAFFQFSTPCNGACFNPSGSVPSTLGSSIQSTSRNTDHTLLLLDEPAPAGSFFLGWNSSPVANSNGTALHRVSHPGGAPQAYSEQDVDTSAGTCSGLPRGSFIYSRDTFGGTEGGSSGAPVVNSSGEVVGQLFGACGFNVNDPCDSASNATVDGAFAAYFSDVQQFLDPQGGGCTDNDGDGFCNDVDCDDNNAGVNPGAAEVCDGVDNDCDGSVDEGCGSCLPVGSSCSVNSDCCSNKCKGKTGAKTCK